MDRRTNSLNEWLPEQIGNFAEGGIIANVNLDVSFNGHQPTCFVARFDAATKITVDPPALCSNGLPMSKMFHHDLPRVEDYLHHRAPYLLVTAIQRLEDKVIQTSTLITGDEFFMRGHFPGASIVPGAMMQEMTTQTAGILIAARFNPMERFNTHDPLFNEYALGVLMRVRGARFRGFARPGDTLHTRVELVDRLSDVFEFEGRITLNGKLVMNNSFQLANIPSATLQGKGSVSAVSK